MRIYLINQHDLARKGLTSMFTMQQLNDLAVAILAANEMGLVITGFEHFDHDHLGVRFGPEGAQPPFTLYDQDDLSAAYEAGIARGKHETEFSATRAYDMGFGQGMTEGMRIEHDAWAADVEEEFGEAGQRFADKQHRLFNEAEARRSASATPTTALEGEAEIPQGVDNAQPGPDVGDGNADKVDDPYFYVRGSFLGFAYNLRVAITATAITVDGTLLGEEVDFVLSMVPFGMTAANGTADPQPNGATDTTVTVDGEPPAEAVIGTPEPVTA